MKIVWICILFAVVCTAFVSGSSYGNTARKLVKEVGEVGLDDYGPVDPSPSSKKLRPGPIQHGTPLIPYIPRSSPSPPPPPSLRV